MTETPAVPAVGRDVPNLRGMDAFLWRQLAYPRWRVGLVSGSELLTAGGMGIFGA
jgi:hypothetical protein